MTQSKDSFHAGFPSPPPGQLWPSSDWNLVRAAREGAGDEKKQAVEQLVVRYYKPVSRFFERVLRVQGDRLRDLTQEFFARFIEKDFVGKVREEKSFRNFLKVACRRHYINWCEAQRPKGGRAVHRMEDDEGRTIDVAMPEDRFGDLFDEHLRAWYVEQAFERTRAALKEQGKQSYIRILEERMRFDDRKPTDYQTLSAALGESIFAIRNHLTAARKIFRKALLDIAGEQSRDSRNELRELGLLKYLG